MEHREEILSLLDIEASVIELCCVHAPDGREYYLYLKIAPSKYLEFKTAQQLGRLTLSDYGEPLCFGEGAHPPLDVQLEMQRAHGVRHTLESELEELRQK
ncbi:MAG: hypothetical protein J0M12_01225 [Deltaproteobacteria bacterium]|nr:hypothetical protein [Deltaproteobacteria bacterium]